MGSSEGGPGLGEMDIPTPELRGIALDAVGAQEIRAVVAFGAPTFVQGGADAQRGGGSVLLALHFDAHEPGGGGILAPPATDAPLDPPEITLGPRLISGELAQRGHHTLARPRGSARRSGFRLGLAACLSA